MISEMLSLLTDELGEAYKRASEAESEIAAWKQLSAQHEIEIARLRKMIPDQVKAVRKAIEDKCPEVLYTPEPCEICGDTECEDSILQYYIDRCHEAEDIIAAKDAEIARLRVVADAAVELEYILRTREGRKDIDCFTAQPITEALIKAGVSLVPED